jgi:hypothetical protein
MKSRSWSNCLTKRNKLIVNGSLRLNATLRAISKDIRLDLSPKVTLRKMALTIKKPSLPFLRRIH